MNFNIAIYEPVVIKRVEKTELTEQQEYDINFPTSPKNHRRFLAYERTGYVYLRAFSAESVN